VGKRGAWTENQAEMDTSKLVFLDESGVNTNMSRRYGRALGGERAVDAIPLNKGQSTTILSSIRLDGTMVPMIFPGAVNREIFKDYLRDYLAQALRPGDIVIMDNLPAHRVDGVAELIEETGAHVLYLPPYSPDFNPIEMLWSKIKAYLRMVKARTVDALHSAIPSAFSTVSTSDIRGWFNAAGYSC
jgi:transposase